MRLTLRTLLAWLDDTLEPTQVREIGRQVKESPLAQELADRIHRVTRQRRLTVPPSSGADGTDPNIVASYLDNDLDPESVAEFEKKCLKLDVNLAEVASVHQILSLLGQKVKVPAEARTRMYQLVKGREATTAKPAAARRPGAPEPVTKPIPEWVVPEAPRRPWYQRFGPVVGCLALIFLASWSFWRSVTGSSPDATPSFTAPIVVANHDENAAAVPAAPEEPGAGLAADSPAVVPGSAIAAVPGEGAAQPEANGSGASATPAGADTVGATSIAKTADAAGTSKDSSTAAAAPVGSAARVGTGDGIVLRFNAAEREWERLKPSAPLARSDRVLCLAPFRTQLALGKARVDMIGDSEVRILSQAADPAPAVELIYGRVVLHVPSSSAIKLGLTDKAATLEATGDTTLALERLPHAEYGQSATELPALLIYCLKGESSLSVDKRTGTLSTSDVVSVDGTGQVKRSTDDVPPAWAAESEPSPHELQVREQFLRMFHPGQHMLTEAVQAVEDESAEIKRLSVLALKSLGDLSLLMPILSRKDDPIARRSAIAAIRSQMGLGPAAAARVKEQLVQEFGDDKAPIVEKMLIGFSPDEASKPPLFELLVDTLAPEQEPVGVRELALDNLKRLTGRDDLGYDPDHPAEKGFNAWRDLQRQGKLRFAAPRTKTK
jgi:hypothetical protein